MEYYIRGSGALLTEHEFRAMFPQVSLPVVITDEIANKYFADKIIQTPQPQCDEYHTVSSSVEQNAETGKWEIVWLLTEITDPVLLEQITENRKQRLKNQYTSFVRGLLDLKAQEQDYDGILWAVLRASYPGPYQEEGKKYGQWMDACWARMYELLDQTVKQERAELTQEEFVPLMPTLSL